MKPNHVGIKYPIEVILGLEHPTLAEGCEHKLLSLLKTCGFRFEKTSSSGTYVCMNVRQRFLVQTEEQLFNLLPSGVVIMELRRSPDKIEFIIKDRFISADYKRISGCDYIKSCGL